MNSLNPDIYLQIKMHEKQLNKIYKSLEVPRSLNIVTLVFTQDYVFK